MIPKATPGRKLRAKTLNRIVSAIERATPLPGGTLNAPNGTAPIEAKRMPPARQWHPFQVSYGPADNSTDLNIIYVRGGAVIIDGVRCVPVNVGTTPGDSLRASHSVDDTATVADLSIYANVDIEAERVAFGIAVDDDADRSYLLATITTEGRIVQHVVGDIIEGPGETALLHPWKLRVRDGDIEVFEGLAWFHGTAVKAAPGVWVDTGLDVGEATVSVYLLIHADDDASDDYQASYAADTTPPAKDPGPGNRYGLRAYLLGTVDENEYIDQRHRSDIVDDDRELLFGTGIDTSTGNSVYDGSREETIFVDPVWLLEQITNGTPAHNETTGKQGGRDDGGVGADEKEYYHLTKAEWEWVRAKIAEEEE
jgi:hypothetical protein